ncbi:hypothetical protein [Comamonas sp.]|uniref:hypothetical protein n=1 Tax=Comamonas sp. TaxID=34028 RepID=UPI003A8ED08E
MPHNDLNIAPDKLTKYYELRLGAIVKDYEFIRAEQLICIGRVRYIAMFSVALAGAALPAIATVLAAGATPDTDILKVVINRALVLQIITIGISLCAASLLQIYVGVFKQIFSFAAYFRIMLVPEVNKCLAALGPGIPNSPVLSWELWLQNQRRDSKWYTADLDLKAEPILIAAVSIGYMALALVVSFHSNTLVLPCSAASIALLIFMGLKARSLLLVLSEASAKNNE